MMLGLIYSTVFPQICGDFGISIMRWKRLDLDQRIMLKSGGDSAAD